MSSQEDTVQDASRQVEARRNALEREYEQLDGWLAHNVTSASPAAWKEALRRFVTIAAERKSLCTETPVESDTVTITPAGLQALAAESASPDSCDLPNIPHAELWQRYKANPSDSTVRNELAMKYENLVWKLANKYHAMSSGGYSVAEFFSEGFMGLLRAMEKWDHFDQRAKFTTYSCWMIRRKMQLLGVSNVYSFNLKMSINAARRREEHRLGRRTNDFELSRAMGISEEHLNHHLARVAGSYAKGAFEVGLEKTGASTPDPSHRPTISDTVERLARMVRPVNLHVMKRHFGDGADLREISRELGVSRERIRQIAFEGKRKVLSRLNTDTTCPHEFNYLVSSTMH